MKELAYLGRLGFHGGKLLARVLMILLPLAGVVLWKSFRGAASLIGDSEDAKSFTRAGGYDDPSSYLPDEITPTIENTEDSQWAAYYGD